MFSIRSREETVSHTQNKSSEPIMRRLECRVSHMANGVGRQADKVCAEGSARAHLLCGRNVSVGGLCFSQDAVRARKSVSAKQESRTHRHWVVLLLLLQLPLIRL